MLSTNKYKVLGKRSFRHKRKIIIFVAVLASLSLVAVLAYGGYKLYQQYKVFTEKVDVVNDPEITNPVKVAIPSEPEVTIPSAKVLNMAWTNQAPFGNWNLHEESCEEAALLMYHYFLDGKTTFDGKTVITPSLANTEELKMKDWEVKNYGKEPDLTITAWAKFAKDYYGYNSQVFTNITKEDIKKQIAAGHPVVVPVITHALQNPHYGAQPSYHVLVIKGYKEDGVIANDSGVKEGENYFYTWDILFKAIDAQTAQMKQGRVMAILTK